MRSSGKTSFQVSGTNSPAHRCRGRSSRRARRGKRWHGRASARVHSSLPTWPTVPSTAGVWGVEGGYLRATLPVYYSCQPCRVPPTAPLHVDSPSGRAGDAAPVTRSPSQQAMLREQGREVPCWPWARGLGVDNVDIQASRGWATHKSGHSA